MDNPHPSVEKMWREYLSSLNESPETSSKHYTAWHFCSNKKAADELAQLVLKGEKSATATSLWGLEAEGEPLPSVGELSIITNWVGEAQCIIQTVLIETLAFKTVPEEFAAAEGEGDKSLDFWRSVHKEVFTEELLEHGIKFSEDMPVLCETFQVVWPPEPETR